MIDTTTFMLFTAAAWAMIILPGPDLLYVLTRGVSGGRRAGIISGLGVGGGEVIHTLLAIAGLAALLAASLTAFLLLKYVGAAYLIYLGLKTIRDKQALSLSSVGAPTSLRAVFWQGVLTNVLNPKAVLFYVAFLPQFVDPAHGQAHMQILMLGLLFAIYDVVFLCGLAYLTGYVHTWLSRNPRAIHWLRWATGGILISLGLRLAVAQRS